MSTKSEEMKRIIRDSAGEAKERLVSEQTLEQINARVDPIITALQEMQNGLQQNITINDNTLTQIQERCDEIVGLKVAIQDIMDAYTVRHYEMNDIVQGTRSQFKLLVGDIESAAKRIDMLTDSIDENLEKTLSAWVSIRRWGMIIVIGIFALMSGFIGINSIKTDMRVAAMEQQMATISANMDEIKKQLTPKPVKTGAKRSTKKK